jgi:hypothetical protein
MQVRSDGFGQGYNEAKLLRDGQIARQQERITALEAQLDHRDQEIERLHARIDALMLEYCPDVMTPEQVKRWGECQVAEQKELAAAIESLKEGGEGR